MKNNTTTQYLHLEFMTTNELQMDSFSEGLREKIRIFGIILPGINETVGQDSRILRDKLRKLDREIYGDMLEEYEDYLDNNEVDEVMINAEKRVTDKGLLDQLWQMGRKKGLRRSTLRNMGFTGELSGSQVKVGDYRLERTGIFIHSYNLVKT